MLKLFEMLLAGVLASMFYFPFELNALPGVNSKMALAVVGLVCAYICIVERRSLSFPQELLWLIIISGAVSLASLLSITVNRTSDATYVSYIVSFAVWISAAFAVCCIIRGIQRHVCVMLVMDYLIAVCVFQCVMALLIDNVQPVRAFVDKYFALDQELMHRVKRLYGIGAGLDVAGARFSAVLAAMGHYLSESRRPLGASRRTVYIIAFLVITIIGNMIARTTLTGAAIGLAVILAGFIFRPALPGDSRKTTSLLTWAAVLAAGISICVILYNTEPAARKLFRFGFEGFFSLVENGHWETTSTEKLTRTMVVFPETLHTWIIGDGYFLNSRYDINYLGDATDQGYYMGTDIGYLRFLFYFGIVGLIPMMGVIVYSAIVCMRHFPEDRLAFLLALLVGLVVWCKVSTDIFCFFALFLSAAALNEPQPSQTQPCLL